VSLRSIGACRPTAFDGFPSIQAWHKLCGFRLWEVVYHGGG